MDPYTPLVKTEPQKLTSETELLQTSESASFSAREFEARSTQQVPAMVQSHAAPISTPTIAVSPLQFSSSAVLPPSQKCAIVECPNPCYVDESGTVHECCGITHAMEHQRRLALMQCM